MHNCSDHDALFAICATIARDCNVSIQNRIDFTMNRFNCDVDCVQWNAISIVALRVRYVGYMGAHFARESRPASLLRSYAA